MKDLKKYFVGMIAGAVLMTGISAGAATLSPIGKKIDSSYKVTVDGKKLPNNAIVVEGKSYIPTTDVGAATGFKVQFVNKSEGIRMTSSDVTPSVGPDLTAEPSPSATPQNAEWIQELINRTKYDIWDWGGRLQQAKTDKEKADAQKQLDVLNAQLDELEAKLAALQSPTPTP